MNAPGTEGRDGFERWYLNGAPTKQIPFDPDSTIEMRNKQSHWNCWQAAQRAMLARVPSDEEMTMRLTCNLSVQQDANGITGVAVDTETFVAWIRERMEGK